VPTQKRVILLPDEPRVALAAEISTARGVLVVASAHLSFVPGWNMWQLRRLTTELARLGQPCVLLGDMNLPGFALRPAVPRWRPLVVAKTFPAPSPKMQIDHALGFGDLLPVAAGRSVQLPLSDHRALVVELDE
jgi:endonuclease/exonuclease/phosphatase family metal-dependent hydrolase